MKKEKDILNPCGHRNSERVEALMKFPSVCPACLLERIKKLEDGLISIRKSTEIMEARRFAEQALKRR